MKLSHYQKFSLIDWPGRIVSTVFTTGCNFRCKYCHNSSVKTQLTEKEFFSFLLTRQDKLDGVCVTGGEPTIQLSLPSFIKKMKELGFLIKLDTNGSNPKVIEKTLQYIDYVAMDIKTVFAKYNQYCDFDCVDNVKRSIKIIQSSEKDHEFRCTVGKELSTEDVKIISNYVLGSDFYLQSETGSGIDLGKFLIDNVKFRALQ